MRQDAIEGKIVELPIIDCLKINENQPEPSGGLAPIFWS
jgi:hypothetical protein